MKTLLLGFFCFTAIGCATPGAQALGKCELGALAQSVEPLIASVTAIATNPSSTVADLEALATGTVGKAQLACVVAAVEAALAGSSSAVKSDERTAHAVGVLNDYLVKHKTTACAGTTAIL